MAEDYSKGKVESTGKMEGAHGGSSGSGNTGPTGSARQYPKGKGTNMRSDFNPMKKPASTYGICGV